MPTQVVEVDRDNAIASELEAAYGSSATISLVLPSGNRLLAFPEKDFAALHAVFNDPEFGLSLERAVDDYKSGRGSVRQTGERPKPASGA